MSLYSAPKAPSVSSDMYDAANASRRPSTSPPTMAPGMLPMPPRTAAVLGGIGNIPGAMVGGLVLGLLEAFAASYLSLLTGGAFGAEYKDIFAFSILILILIFRPKGLLGEVVRERA